MVLGPSERRGWRHNTRTQTNVSWWRKPVDIPVHCNVYHQLTRPPVLPSQIRVLSDKLWLQTNFYGSTDSLGRGAVEPGISYVVLPMQPFLLPHTHGSTPEVDSAERTKTVHKEIGGLVLDDHGVKFVSPPILLDNPDLNKYRTGERSSDNYRMTLRSEIAGIVQRPLSNLERCEICCDTQNDNASTCFRVEKSTALCTMQRGHNTFPISERNDWPSAMSVLTSPLPT